MNSQQLADALLRSGGNGSVGAVTVQPRQVGAVDVRPRQVGSAPAAMVQQIPQQPVEYSPQTYVAGDLTYFGLGLTSIPANSQAFEIQPPFRPIKPFAPQHLRAVSSIQDLLILSVDIGGINVWASNLGVPIEFFSEVATQPQIDWPTIDPAVGVAFTLSNPTGGALDFKAGLYGTALRR